MSLLTLLLLSASALLMLPTPGAAKKDYGLYCGACRALVDEVTWEVGQVDPKKTIQVGSFRINPDGTQDTTEVPFARSEAHLLEVLEGVCQRVGDYAEVDAGSGRPRSFVRTTARSGEKLDLTNVTISGDVGTMLKFACENIAEEFEDDIISLFVHETDHVADKLCSKKSDYCEHTLHVPHDEL
ncbi:protein canopy homolog 2-like [Lampetra fluviatilis]